MGRNWKRAQPQGPAPRQFLTRQTMFGNLKTKGFALEATHLTDPDKLCTLLALLAFAVALTVKTGVAMAHLHPIPVKNHGRRARSLFALGHAAQNLCRSKSRSNNRLPRPTPVSKTPRQALASFGLSIASRVRWPTLKRTRLR